MKPTEGSRHILEYIGYVWIPRKSLWFPSFIILLPSIPPLHLGHRTFLRVPPVQATTLHEVVHGDIWAQLGTCPDIARNTNNPPELLRKIMKNPGFQSYTCPPASFHTTEIQWQETGPASCETISADAAQPPCCVTVSCTAWWVHASSAVTAPGALVFGTPNLRVSHSYEIGQLFDSASKLFKQPNWGNEKAWINRYFRVWDAVGPQFLRGF